MTADIGVEKPQPTWPIAAALGISGLLFFLYIYTLIAPIIRNPNIIAPYSTRQAGRSRRKLKSSWLSRWLLGAGTPRHLQSITPSQSRTSRRTANRDLESSPSSSTSHTHGYFPSSPSSAKLSPHPIMRSHPSFQHTFNPSYNTLHTPLTPSFSTSPTGVRVSLLDHDLPSHTPHVRGGQHTLSPPPPAYVSSPNSPSPDYAPVFVEQTSGYTTPPMSPGTYPTRAQMLKGVLQP
ncbi:hypothetical protein FA13DRAFT_1805607 [Coprinellus micaceus]|uniref:Uncharacterized protein n=1 Tax=Coprinellus micaceus TaxID=71717 RepID=A0A4Y7RZL7_COPMI|nr:hypothetical protein FA13DRAFT_1805607 [Coprinellus micaceus]